MMPFRPMTQITKDTRRELKAKFPQWTFSVTKGPRGSRSLDLRLMGGPVAALRANTPDAVSGYAQVNHYTLLHDDYERPYLPEGINNGNFLTREAWDVLRAAVEIANRENWDNSDSQTDYFDVNFYLHVSVGKWDRPYQVNS